MLSNISDQTEATPHSSQDSQSVPKSLYEQYRGAMAYIEVKTPDGDIGIGSAFHIGEGVFVTARHVVDNLKIVSMATTESVLIPDENGNATVHNDPIRYRSVGNKSLTIKSGPHFHPDCEVDVAIIVTHETDIIHVPLGGHLDDWINDSQFILREAIVMGYPPIPFADRPVLISTRGEINAVIDKYNAPHPHFIISIMPRGGFSGGLCLIDFKFALGVVIQSLVKDNKEVESGFMAVISVEPIFTCLQHFNILPEVQKEGWEGLWDRNPNFNYDFDESPFEDSDMNETSKSKGL